MSDETTTVYIPVQVPAPEGWGVNPFGGGFARVDTGREVNLVVEVKGGEFPTRLHWSLRRQSFGLIAEGTVYLDPSRDAEAWAALTCTLADAGLEILLPKESRESKEVDADDRA